MKKSLLLVIICSLNFILQGCDCDSSLLVQWGLCTKPQTSADNNLSPVPDTVTTPPPITPSPTNTIGPKINPEVGMVITYPGEYSNLTGPIIQSTFQSLKALGVSLSYIYLDWGDIETSNGNFNWGGLDYDIQNNQDYGLKTAISFKIVDTNQIGKLPNDLTFTNFSNTTFQLRVITFLDTLLTRYSGKINYLYIGNEIDDYFYTHRSDFSAYVSFYENIYSTIKSKYPGVKIGVISTYHDAFRNNALDLIETIGTKGDLIGFSLYPQVASKTQVPFAPSDVSDMFAAMSSISSRLGKKFAITETGWGSLGFGSSEAQQSTYVEKVFLAYRSALLTTNQIEYLSVFNFYDYSPTVVNQFAVKYGIPNPSDLLLLFATTGYYTNSGSTKAALSILQREITITREL